MLNKIFSLKNTILLSLAVKGIATDSIYFLLIFTASQSMPPWTLTALALVPAVSGILLAAPLGAAVDRLSTKKLWQASLIVDFICLPLFFLPTTIWFWLLLVTVTTASEIVSGAAIFKILPKISGMNEKNATAYLVGLGSFLGIIVPVIASLLYSFFGRFAFISAAIIFAPALIALLRLIPDTTNKPNLEPLSFKEIFLGLRALGQSQKILVYLPVMFAVVLFTSVEDLSGIIYLQQVGGEFISNIFPTYRGDPGSLGYSLTVIFWSLGTLITAALSTRPSYRVSALSSLLWGGMGVGLAIMGEGLLAYAPLIAAIFLLGGMCNSMHNIGIRQMIYDSVPEERQGQVLAITGAFFQIFASLGQLLGTPYLLGEPRQVIIVSGAAASGVILLFLLARPLLRKAA